MLNNQELQQRIKALEQCDVESAAVEVQRAAQTVRQLTAQIGELKQKLSQ